MTENNATVTPLTPKEEAVLREMGLLQGGLSPADRATLHARTDARRTALYKASLTLEDAAARLGEPVAIVRARADAGSLYALRRGEEMRFPEFQFTENGELPGLGLVLEALHAGLRNPLAVQGFFTLPDPDLEINEASVSPAAWLANGGDVSTVVALADDLQRGM